MINAALQIHQRNLKSSIFQGVLNSMVDVLLGTYVRLYGFLDKPITVVLNSVVLISYIYVLHIYRIYRVFINGYHNLIINNSYHMPS